jgi:hypothetical protein
MLSLSKHDNDRRVARASFDKLRMTRWLRMTKRAQDDNVQSSFDKLRMTKRAQDDRVAQGDKTRGHGDKVR